MVKHATENPGERNDLRFKGVRKRKWGKWVSEIRLPNSRERIWLGSYDSAEKAARAFDAALYCLRGRSAKFNFPDNPPEIAGGRSLTSSEIQTVAARFANSVPTRVQSEQSVSETQIEYSSPSVSEVTTLQLDSDGVTDGSFLDLFKTMGSGNFVSDDYGLFPGFDELSNDIFAPPLPTVDYGEENFDGILVQDSFLWNF
ncbi:hypothetical protein Ddye_020269 [Dipteronia dyeriana]|uniref:AP2/ERF domain-containing protein n=1 Tax=Dipteronia dyeriana TaxID=168575 RepID=A0AAD9WV82_9ROSI|nr:hypothetical protein Ddye_020269 [Dipteronia dyeriana]